MGLVDQTIQALRASGWETGDAVVVAASGGGDSMALLALAEAAGLTGVVAHMHYGLRGDDSDRDAVLVAREAARWGWPCSIAHRSVVRSDRGLQAEARALRYAWFERVLSQTQARWILTAHHADDQAETLLLHLLRAADPVAAVAGMPSRQGAVLRPLLGVRRSELRAWAVERGLVWREDASNDSPKYLRNRVRHEVLPLLEAIRPGTVSHLARLAKRGRAVADGLDELKASAQSVPNRFEWTPEWPLFEERLHAWGKLHGVSGEALMGLKSVGAKIETDEGLIVRERGALVASPHVKKSTQTRLPRPKANGSLNGLKWEVLSQMPDDLTAPPTTCLLDADAVVWPLTLRSWKPGDRLAPYGLNGHQLVSDLLTQSKVPSSQRELFQVLEDAAGTIHWLLGIRTARHAALNPRTENAVRFTLDSP